MALTHTPAHTTCHPDRFVDESTEASYDVFQDIDAEDPRIHLEAEHAALWAYSAPVLSSSTIADKPEGNIAIDAFARFCEKFPTVESDELTERWLRIFHPESMMRLATATIRGNSQGDWLEVIAAVEDGYGTPESLIDEVRMWAFGDVWTVRPDTGESLSGIYADSAEKAVKLFREDCEQSDTQCDRHGGLWGSDETCEACVDDAGRTSPIPVIAERTLHLRITADDDDRADEKIAAIISALHDSDALPTGVQANTEPFSTDPDWNDDVYDVADADHVEIRWTSRDARGRVLHRSDAVVNARQAQAMFEAIGATS